MKDYINREQFEICTNEYYDDGYKVKTTNLVRDGDIVGSFMRMTDGYGIPYVTCLEAKYNGTAYRTRGDDDEQALHHFIEQVNIDIAYDNIAELAPAALIYHILNSLHPEWKQESPVDIYEHLVDYFEEKETESELRANYYAEVN